MIDFLDNIDAEMNDGGARVVPIITEIHEVSDGTDIHDNKADDIPILPLRNMVLFPMMTMPVSVGRDKSMRLIKDVEESHCSIAVFCQYDSQVEDPAEKDLYRYGTFTTAVDNQPSVEIKVLQGERPMAAQNKQIGIFHLDGIMPARRGEPQIEVTFDIDANGILNVSAKDKATGKEQKIRIEASTGLSDDEIKRMKAEAEANAEADKREKERVDKLNKADATIFQTEKQLAELGDKIPADKKEPIEKALADLKAAYEKKDADACEAAGNALMTAFQAASAEMYNAANAANAQQGGAQGPQGGTYNAGQDFGQGGQQNNGGNGGKDAEDVDFEEVK